MLLQPGVRFQPLCWEHVEVASCIGQYTLYRLLTGFQGNFPRHVYHLDWLLNIENLYFYKMVQPHLWCLMVKHHLYREHVMVHNKVLYQKGCHMKV